MRLNQAADLPHFSVIIPVWNGEQELGHCLDALQAQMLAQDRFEVIVVDNGSEDRTREIARAYDFVTLVEERRPGSYAARNKGLSVARGKYVAFTDADCRPYPDWLSNAYDILQEYDEKKVILAGNILLFRDRECDSQICQAFEGIFSFNQENYASQGLCTTANWISLLQPIREAGGFDAARKSGGDFDLSHRLSQGDFVVRYAPSVRIAHPTRGRIVDLVRKRQRVAGGHWMDCRSKAARIKLILATPKRLLGLAHMIVKYSSATSGQRIALIGLATLLSTASLTEYLRLAVGGTCRR
jgi:glycosyltransferase involved in cell wall biosynthesis